MKYRRLRPDELEDVQLEFVRFLATQGIPTEEWERLKTEAPKRVDALLDQFSEIVFDNVLKEVQYLEHRRSDDLKVFRCGKQKMELMGLRIAGESELDFTRNQDAKEMIRLLAASDARLQLYAAEKKYGKARELELFELLESGARILRDSSLFDTLYQLRKED